MKRIVLSLCLCLCTFVIANAAKSIRLIVDAGDFDRHNSIVSVDISALGIDTASKFNVRLYEKVESKNIPVKSQLVWEGQKPMLYWILEGNTSRGTVREYIVKRTKKENVENEEMETVDTGRALVLKSEGVPVLQYNYAITYPPVGVDISYQRSGFIHPAYSPKGNILTTIQPKDHRHHYGIWNPWTRIEYNGELYDLWNLGDKKGTVRAEGIEKIYSGNVFTGFIAHLGHYIFKPGEEKIMDEVWNVRTWNVQGDFLWDFTSELSPSTALPVLIKAYRYAGFGWRATEEWTKDNCEMVTSEGKTRQQIDGTTARWIYVTGQCRENGRSGMLFMSYPENYNYPEPLRIWDENANAKRGDAFVNFAPTKNKDWMLDAGKSYRLRYRVCAYDGEMNKEWAEQLWHDFAYPPKVIIQ